jgi:hypothetical protein
VCEDGFTEVEVSEKRREAHKESKDYLKEQRKLIVEQKEFIRKQGENLEEERTARRDRECKRMPGF